MFGNSSILIHFACVKYRYFEYKQNKKWLFIAVSKNIILVPQRTISFYITSCQTERFFKYDVFDMFSMASQSTFCFYECICMTLGNAM